MLWALAAAALLAGCAPAYADPISFAILSTVSATLAASAVAVSVTTFALTTAASLALSYLVSALMPKQPATPGTSSGRLSAGGAVPRSLIVGQSMTAGSLVYANTFGNAGGTPNAFLVQVIALSDIPVGGLAEIWVNGAEVTWDPEATPGAHGIAIPEYEKNNNDHLWIRFYDGTQGSADSALVSLFSGDSNRPYGSDRIGTGIAYVVVTARVNTKLWSGYPELKFVLDGIKLYDRRFDDENGGSGDQREDDPSTWEFTANPIVIVENILRGIRYDGQWLYGAQTVSPAMLPADSWTAAATECDAPIDLDGGGDEPQFVAGGEIPFNVQPADAIEELLKSCNGKLAEIGGRYKVRAGAAGSSVFSISDADILSTDKQTFEPFPSLGRIVNAVTAKYVSPTDGWSEKDAPPLYDADLEDDDGGRRQAADVTYGFVHSGTQVQRLMKAERATQRAFRQHAIPLGPEAFVLEPLDVITWTSARNGYSAKLFDVTHADDLPNLNNVTGLKEIDPAAYDWDEGEDEQPVVTAPTVVVRPSPQAIVAPSFTGVAMDGGNGRQVAAVHVTWDPVVDDIRGVMIQIRRDSDDVVVLEHSQLEFVEAGEIFLSHNILPETDYEGRIQLIPASNRDATWSSWLPFSTPNVLISQSQLDAELDAKIDSIGVPVDLTSLQNAVVQLAQLVDNQGQIIDGLVSTVGDVSAQALFRMAVNANPDSGAVALIEANVRSETAFGWAFGGWQLACFSDVEVGLQYSRFRVKADLFQVGLPEAAGGDFIPLFEVGEVNGEPAIVLRAEAYRDNGIGKKSLALGAATTIHYLEDASGVTRTWTAWNATDTVSEIIVATEADGPTIIEVQGKIDESADHGAAAQGNMTFTIEVNGVSVFSTNVWPNANGFERHLHHNFCFKVLKADLAAGTNTITLKMFVNQTSGSNTSTVSKILWTVHEHHKPVLQAGSAADAAVSYHTALTGTAANDPTHSGVSIGSAATNRLVVLAVTTQGGNYITSITIGGIEATRIRRINPGGDFFVSNEIWQALVPSGTTADIAIETNGSLNAYAIGVFSVTSVSVNAIDTAIDSSDAGATLSLDDIAANKGGVGIVVSGGRGRDTFAGAWSAGDTVTERAEGTIGNLHYAFYSFPIAANSTTNDFIITSNNASGADKHGAVGATWR